MRAGLSRFGSDFGNQEADRLFFPRDVTAPALVAAKQRVLAQNPSRNQGHAGSEIERRALAAAEEWLLRTLESEGHRIDISTGLPGVGAQIAEDFVVLSAPPGALDRTLWLHVCFPGGWRPERLLGKSFLQIHAPIPDFDVVARRAASLTESMVERGPYVRFVWTVSADAELDHHPEQGRRDAWSPDTPGGFLRVERQVTVPLPSARAAVFIIRTYLYAFHELSHDQRLILASALELMPREIQRYKGLAVGIARAVDLLRA